MEKNLVITNYDNFKDLSYFIGQHKIALRMLDEIERFYLAFLKSKLIYSLDISKYPGKIIKKKETYKDTFQLNSKYDKNFDTVKVGDHIKNYTVTKITKPETVGYGDYKLRKMHVRYDNDSPKIDYINLLGDIYCERSHMYDNRMLWPTEEMYINQISLKKELEEKWAKDKAKFYFISKSNGEFDYFCEEEELPAFKFTLSDDASKLIIYKDEYTGGTETDRWKTYSYEGYNHLTFTFNVNNGNYIEKDNTFIYTRRNKLEGVHNGWHPYDDD